MKMVQATIAGNLQLRSGSKCGTGFFCNANGLFNPVAVALKVKRHAGKRCNTDGNECHGELLIDRSEECSMSLSKTRISFAVRGFIRPEPGEMLTPYCR